MTSINRLIDRFKDGAFADAGPVGLGFVALKKKKPEEALKIFENAIEVNPGQARFKEATLGKLEALIALGKLDDAMKLALDTVGDKVFRGEPAGKALLLMARIYREQATKANKVEDKLEFLKKAHGVYQKTYVAYQSFPEVCAEAYWQAIETLKELGKQDLADETLKAFKANKKLENTDRYKKAS